MVRIGDGGATDTDDRRVLVAGATGGTGREALRILRKSDDVVRAMTRSEDSVDRLDELGADEVVIGDLLSASEAETAVEGCDAVLCTVGTSPGPGMLFGDLVDGEGVINLVDAAEGAVTDRFVLVSSIGVGDSKAGMPLPLRGLMRAIGILPAKERAETRLRGADLDHTILRPGGLTDDEPTGDVLVGEGGDTVSGSIPRGDVAGLAVAALDTPESRNRSFELVSSEGVRGDPAGLVDLDWAKIE